MRTRVGIGKRGLAGLVVLAGAASLAGWASPAAALTNGVFCPSTPGGTVSLNPFPSRCVGVFHTAYRGVSFDNALTSVIKCAAIKPNSDGSGGDVGAPAVCADGQQNPALLATVVGFSGWATGINKASNFHTGFFGGIVIE